MRVAVRTEIIEENVNFEVLRNHFSLVFADIFRRELHLTSADVVSILDESSIKHNSAEGVIFERLVSEFNFDVASQRKRVSLLFTQ